MLTALYFLLRKRISFGFWSDRACYPPAGKANSGHPRSAPFQCLQWSDWSSGPSVKHPLYSSCCLAISFGPPPSIPVWLDITCKFGKVANWLVHYCNDLYISLIARVSPDLTTVGALTQPFILSWCLLWKGRRPSGGRETRMN